MNVPPPPEPYEPETAPDANDPDREPPRRQRIRRARSAAGSGEAGARVPVEPAPSVDFATTDEKDSLIQRRVFGKRTPKTLSEPYVPTQAEIDERNKSHLPWRSWCTACVGGGAAAHPHHAVPDDPENSRLPHVLMGQEVKCCQ